MVERCGNTLKKGRKKCINSNWHDNGEVNIYASTTEKNTENEKWLTLMDFHEEIVRAFQ